MSRLPWECYPQAISLGAGVQSSCSALMASEGLIKPMPRYAAFADTTEEPATVYRWLEWLRPRLAFPVIDLSRGDLSEEMLTVRKSRTGTFYLKHSIPAFTKNHDGTKGMMPRHCTQDFKIALLLQYAKKTFPERRVCQWIGISTDEADRAKPSQDARVVNRYPLLELGMSRQDCIAWMKSRGYPEPPRSACKFCPYHSDDEWMRLRDEEPKEFAEAVRQEQRLQEAVRNVPALDSVPYLHSSRVPLSEVVFQPGRNRRHFSNECVGMCGV